MPQNMIYLLSMKYKREYSYDSLSFSISYSSHQLIPHDTNNWRYHGLALEIKMG
jgi:hypothetical protein